MKIKMVEIEKLQLFDLNLNQSKLINFFIKHRGDEKLTYDRVKELYKPKRSFNRAVLKILMEKNLIYVVKEKRPNTYKLNENRFKEILKEKENNFVNTQTKLKKILQSLEENNNLKTNKEYILKVLGDNKQLLRLSNTQFNVLKTLISKADFDDFKTALSLKQIADELNKKGRLTKLRNNILTLDRMKFILKEKRVATNYYLPNKLEQIIKHEQNYQAAIWDERRKQMEKVVNFFEKELEKPDREKGFQIKSNLNEIKQELLFSFQNAEKEILLDLRCNFVRTDIIKEFLEDIFKKLIEILNLKEKIKVKMLLKVDDWLIHRLDFIFLHLIQNINPIKFEFRVPPERSYSIFRILIDEKVMEIPISHELTHFEKGLIITNKARVRKAKLEINHLWENSLDIRDVILDYRIDQKLENVIKTSDKKHPPIYNFTDNIKITGVRKVLRVILRLFQNAEKEILTIIGPLYKAGESSASILKIIMQENFYSELNSLLDKKSKEGLNIQWIRNTTDPHLNLYESDEKKKAFIDLVLSLYPHFKMKQIDLEQYQFSIIDQKILGILEFYGQFRLVLNFDSKIKDDYYTLFQKIWSDAYDIRTQWLSEVSEPLKAYIQNTFKTIENIDNESIFWGDKRMSNKSG